MKTNKFMNIFIEVDKKKVNIFKIKKSFQEHGSANNVLKIKREDQCFYLDIWIVEVGRIQNNSLL